LARSTTYTLPAAGIVTRDPDDDWATAFEQGVAYALRLVTDTGTVHAARRTWEAQLRGEIR